MLDIPLLTGWFPVAVPVAAGLLCAGVVLRPGRRWWTRWLPLCVLVGAACAYGMHRMVLDDGMAGEGPPRSLMVWVGVAVAGAVALPLTWRGSGPVRRALAVSLVPVAVLAAALSANAWTGYFRSTAEVAEVASGNPVPGSVTPDRLAGMRDTVPDRGVVVAVDIPVGPSGFTHRTEYVYLPPVWFAGPVPPRLPVVEMIGGAYASPRDWIRTGDADLVADAWAEQHGGSAPVLVFADAGGAFATDTECVDGPHGASATHLEQEVPDYVLRTFGVTDDPAGWAVLGWSMGGTCAVSMTARHPGRYHTFVSISGDTGANTGNPERTLADLYGGDRARMAAFDPATQFAAHAPFTGVQGVFEEGLPGAPPLDYLAGPMTLPPGVQARGSADVLAPRAAAAGVDSLVIRRDLPHTWAFAELALREVFPWLAGRIGTPGAPRLPLTAAAAGRPVITADGSVTPR